MTKEELERVKRYSDKIQAATGEVLVLTKDELEDLRQLIQKWLDEDEME
ncbi:hypothetical protein ES703_00380 [subsurface metagenome]